MLPLRVLRATATKRLLPAVTSHSFSTTSIYRNKDPIKAAEDVAQPHLPNRSSTVGHDVPKVGAANAPPEFLGMVDPNYKPKDAGSGEAKSGEVTGSHAATGEVGSSDSASVGYKQQSQGQGSTSGDKSKQDPVSVSKGNKASSEPLSDSPATAPSASAEINETDWTNLKHEPLNRDGEDERTMRARLVYQSRKRGILETDLLLSTFADEHLPSMSVSEMSEYDRFLDENDWDIYYWCTQESPTDEPGNLNLEHTQKTSHNTAKPRESASPAGKDKLQAPPGALGMGAIEQPAMRTKDQGLKKPYQGENSGEWAQTVGTVKQAYRPVPEKWQNSDILKKLRDHVESRKATSDGDVGKGMGRMPDMKTYNS